MTRQARQSRPQLVCVLADNSASMAGEKARAATDGVREMIMECQARGPAGPERSYFKLVLIRFDNTATLDYDMVPVREIDPDDVTIAGDGDMTNITDALQKTLEGLDSYIQALKDHPERAEHPLPLVLLFSDGEHNVGDSPVPIADQIKKLALDGDPVIIATAGVSVGNEKPDGRTLRAIASPGCYVHIASAQALTEFISSVGSSGASRPEEVTRLLQDLRE
jgi:uncharacterized protein YegL